MINHFRYRAAIVCLLLTSAPVMETSFGELVAGEPASFERMAAYAEAEGLTRLSKVHREIYLSDFQLFQ